MYYYYAIATFGKTVWWKKYITMAQIVQFVIDLTATWPYPFLYFSAEGKLSKPKTNPWERRAGRESTRTASPPTCTKLKGLK